MKINNCPMCDKKPNIYEKMCGPYQIVDIKCFTCGLHVEAFPSKIIEIWNDVLSYVNKKHLSDNGWQIECDFINLYYALSEEYKKSFPRECKICVRFHNTDHISILWHQDDELICSTIERSI